MEGIDKVNRFEVIDHSGEKIGRTLVKYGVKVEVSIQDEGRTMKVFLTDSTDTTSSPKTQNK